MRICFIIFALLVSFKQIHANQLTGFTPLTMRFPTDDRNMREFHGAVLLTDKSRLKTEIDTKTWTEAMAKSIYDQFNNSDEDLENGLKLLQIIIDSAKERSVNAGRQRRIYSQLPGYRKYLYRLKRSSRQFILDTSKYINIWFSKDVDNNSSVLVVATKAFSSGPENNDDWLSTARLDLNSYEIAVDETTKWFWKNASKN